MKQDQCITHITVGIDEQGAADHAVRAGFALAEAFDARLDLVHAVRVDLPPWMEKALLHHPNLVWNVLLAAKNSRIAHLHEVVDKARLGSPDDLITVEEGKPSKVIGNHALEKRSDLIVLGGHRHRKGFHIGSTARAVMAHSRCPVWVQSDPIAKIERILAAIDMSPDSRLVLAMARDLGSRLGAKVCVFHSFVPPHFPYQIPAAAFDAPNDHGFEDFKAAEREQFDRIVAALDWRSVEHDTRFAQGDAVEGILAMQDSADLIVMGTHGRTGLSRALLGSQSYRVLRKAHRPVLVVPDPEREFEE